MHILKIDEKGFLIGVEHIDENEQVDYEYVTTLLPTDEEGYQLSFYKPLWTGTEWVEGATQEYIDELNNYVPELTETETLSNYLLDVDMRLIMIELGM